MASIHGRSSLAQLLARRLGVSSNRTSRRCQEPSRASRWPAPEPQSFRRFGGPPRSSKGHPLDLALIGAKAVGDSGRAGGVRSSSQESGRRAGAPGRGSERRTEFSTSVVKEGTFLV